MLILLPPSETKTHAEHGAPMAPDRLSFPELAEPRAAVAADLAVTSAYPDATERLGVSATLAAQVAANTRLATAPALPVARLYTGVLYDALDVASLAPTHRARAQRSIVVVSALYGAVRLTDRLAPYRLAMNRTLPASGGLAAFWRPHLAAALGTAAGTGLIVDCRSSTYATAWRPRGQAAERWVKVAVPGASHDAKYTRGLVVRALSCAAAPRSPQALAQLLGATFGVDLHAPARANQGWQLDVASVPRGRPAATSA